ncbi:MAG: LacI family transcriptional regulator [Bacilli bacterium]|jgi:LacI family transcriptional regulator|nr:LacI family transcriptional regulator [Bacilli bacterium]
MATINDVAALAQVSKATVSRYLNNKSVSKKTKIIIKKAIDELGYVPSQIAQGLSNKKSNIIGIIVPDIINPFFSELVSQIEKKAINDNCSCMIFASNNDIDIEKKSIQTCIDYSVQGIIMATSNILNDMKIDIPMVAIDRDYGNSIKYVGIDNKKVGHIILDYFIKEGCSKILCVMGPTNVTTTREREQGIVDKALQHEIEVDFINTSYFDIDKISTDIMNLKNENIKYDGIFLGNEIICLVYLKLRMKKDCVLMSMDGTFLSSLLFNDIKVIKQPIIEMAHSAYQMLLQWNDQTERIILDVEVI